MLTIAIPTYNRNETLLRNLARLMPQLNEQCHLVLLDNCSPVPVEDTLVDLLAQYPEVSCEIIRNRTNIGANANITRCLEICETEWLWLLGDDDTPHPQAIERVFRDIEAQPDALYINYSFDEVRTQKFVTRGLEDFVENLDYSANLPWISSSIRRASVMLPNIKFGYQYAYSLMPHVAILMTSIDENSVCVFSPEQLVTVERLETPVEEQWSSINLALGFPVLFDIPMPSKVRKQFASKLLMTNRGCSIGLHALIYQIMLSTVKHQDSRSAIYIYDQICQRAYYFDRGFKRRAEMFAGRLALRFPGAVAAAYKMVKRRELINQPGQDRYERM